jgi:7-cyano-7-deazaguanine synthase
MYILSLSGGLDSAVLCASLVDAHGVGAVLPVFFVYGAKHNAWEGQAAARVAGHYGLALTRVDISAAFAGLASALLRDDPRPVPRADYSPESMGLTVVPGRNLIFASALAAIAESRGGGHIALATHSGDHHLYPDCRPAFNESLAETVRLSSDGAVRVITPFSGLSKADIVKLGVELGAPLALTRSCYQNSPLSCGFCGTCRERLQAFADNGLEDPIEYAAR